MKSIISLFIIAIYFLCFVSCINLNTRYYNEVNYKEYSTFEDLKAKVIELDNNGNEVVNTNLVLGVSSEECKQLFESPAFRGSQRYAGGDVFTTASLPISEYPYKVSNDCAEIFFYKIHTSLDTPWESTVEFDHQSLSRWSESVLRSNIMLKNEFTYPIYVFWLDESQDPRYSYTIEVGETTPEISTFIGHIFSFHKSVETYLDHNGEEVVTPGEPVDFMVVNGEEIYFISPKNRIETCDSIPESERIHLPGHIDCADLENRLAEFTHYVWHKKRLGLNYVQPKFVAPVTDEGFLKIKMPEDTYKWLKAWYDEALSEKIDVETAVGPCMNQYVAPSQVTHLDPHLKDRLRDELKPILQNWYKGSENLVLTSIYGIRRYNNGSVLRMHVDTVNTHVVSAIINVDQVVDKDWPLLILDHEDNEHNITMAAGEMVLYESAKLLHGRPEPFVGSHYDNIFIHFMPESGWDYGWV